MVSIHTPTQGVTCSHRQHHPFRQFQSTHPRRVWRYHATHWLLPVTCFNPHTHAGCDRSLGVRQHSVCVSIHTPTQGVTVLFGCCYILCCFNPHTHAGCDFIWFCFTFLFLVSIHTPTQGVTIWGFTVDNISKFQSTHPRRVWHKYVHYLSISINCFNPHTHAGCDWWGIGDFRSLVGFNPHTHAGCDPSQFLQCPVSVRFNPHTHAGCDLWKRDLF